MKRQVDWDQLFRISKDFWTAETDNVEKYLNDQINKDLPWQMLEEIQNQRKRLRDMM